MARMFDFVCESCGHIELSKEVDANFSWSTKVKCPKCKKKTYGVSIGQSFKDLSFKINGYSYNNGYSK